jgi:hypothetical protein
MCTKFWADGDVHKYFSPYDSPYDGYINFMNVLDNMRTRIATTVCRNNLRQIGIGYQGFLQDHGAFPSADDAGEWSYGGVEFVGTARTPVVPDSRPINAYLAGPSTADRARAAEVFRCPADRGVSSGTPLPGQPLTWSDEDAHVPLFDRFGTSYLANAGLSDRSRIFGPTADREPIHAAEIAVATSRLLVAGDPVWHLATRPNADPGDPAIADLSWHTERAAGNMLAADGSVRFVEFAGIESSAYTLSPR